MFKLAHRFAAPLLVLLPVLAAAQEALPTPPHAALGRSEFPDADAVILRQVQEWTLGQDGWVRLVEHKWVKLLSPRAIRGVADPRIDYREGAEEVTVLMARTFTPDGRIVDAPDYSRNVVAPGGVSGFPAFADLRQLVVSFSAVEPEAIFELHTERRSKPGRPPWLWADLRLEDEYPTVEREVVVRVPAGTPLRHGLNNLIEPGEFSCSQSRDGSSYHWSLKGLRPCEDEARSARWQERCGRLRFTTCAGPSEWLKTLLSDVERACQPAESINAFAKEALADEIDETSKTRKIAGRLKSAVTVVGSPAAWTGHPLRTAADVLASGYASAPEAAALCLAAMRSAGLDAAPVLAVHAETWTEDAAVDTDAAAFLVQVTTSDGPLWVDPREGLLDLSSPSADWTGRRLLWLDAGGEVQRHAPAGAAARNRLELRGSLTLDREGLLTGRLHLRLEGGFVEAESLRDEPQKRSRLQAVARRLIPELSVTEVSVSRFGDDVLLAEVGVERKDALEKIGDLRCLALNRDLPFMAAVDLPLDRPDRRAPVRLPWPFAETVEVNLEFPDGWEAVVVPASVPAFRPGEGRVGHIEQVIESSAKRLHVRRQVRVDVAELPAAEFGAVRDALNQLRGEACRRIVFQLNGAAASQPVEEPARKNGS